MADIPYMSVKDIRPGVKNINVMFIVLEMGKPTRTKDGHDVRSCKVADKSGSINVSIWDEAGDLLQSGDICRLTKGYASLWKGCLTVYTGKNGVISKMGEFCFQFTEIPNMSETNQDFIKNDQPPQQRKSPTESDGGQPPQNHPQGNHGNSRLPLGPGSGPPSMGGPGGNGQYRGPCPPAGPRGPHPINGSSNRSRGGRR